MRIYLSGDYDWEAIRGVIGMEVSNLGLQLNEEKTHLIEGALPAEHFLLDPALGRVSEALQAGDGIRHVKALLESGFGEQEPSPRRVRFCLKVLGARDDPFAFPLLQSRPDILTIAPRECGSYLGRLLAARRIDAAWIVGQASLPCDDRSAAQQLHLLRALSSGRLGEVEAAEVEQTSLGGDVSQYVPRRSWGVEARARGPGWRPVHATELALTIGDAHLRRALILSLRRCGDGPKKTVCLKKLRAAVPELAISTAWVEAGAAGRSN
ncbi:MAG: hypothetical protein ACRDIX_05835 [Actinomycetota bacterium]